MKNLLLIALALIPFSFVNAQVAINYDGSQPTSHSILDIKSDTTGMIIPRMSTIQKNVLASKLDSSHEGMIIFDRTGNILYVWSGSEFEPVKTGTVSELQDSDGDTYVDVESGSDVDDILIGTGGTSYWILKNGRIEFINTGKSVFIGNNAGEDDDLSDNNNIFIGENSGHNNTTGYSNIAVGSYALFMNGVNPTYSFSSADNIALGNNVLRFNTIGYKNVSVGSESMYSNTTGQRNNTLGYKTLYANTSGYDNVAIGNEAMTANTEGYYNVVIGSDALRAQTTGYRNISIGKSSLYNSNNANYNIAIGASSMFSSTSGNGNIAIGYQSGYDNLTGAKNVFIGYQAGYSETGSDKLYIDNSSTSSPLVYGDFDSNVFSSFGFIGVNTKTPIGELQVHSTTKTNNILYVTPKATGSGDSSSVYLSEDNNGTYGMYWMYDGTGNEMELWGKSGTLSYGPHITVDRNDGDFFIDGSMALGGDFASGYKLSVAGNVICEELRVNLQADWPDYVFTDEYDLMPVLEVDRYIRANGHLPNVPSAIEIEESGLKVGETQRMMMEKIEELTLYIIEQQKQIEQLKEQLNSLSNHE